MPRYSKWSSLPFVFLNILYTFPTPMYAMFPGQHIILDWLIIILFKEYTIMMLLTINFLKPLVTLFFHVKTFFSTPCFATMCVCVCVCVCDERVWTCVYDRPCSWPGAALVPASVVTSLADCHLRKHSFMHFFVECSTCVLCLQHVNLYTA